MMNNFSNNYSNVKKYGTAKDIAVNDDLSDRI